jgi:general secretion pathway protein K
MHLNHKKESGSAIVAVLLIVAIITIISVGMMVQQRIDIRRTQQIQTSNQAYRYFQAVLYWAAGAILSAQGAEAPPSDELWQRDFPSTIVAGQRGQVSGHLERLDHRTNLNSFTQATSTGTAQTLVELVNKNSPEVSKEDLSQIMQSVSEWISNMHSQTDRYYLSQTPPYRAAHMPMASPSELRLVVGVDANIYTLLEPYIITLPTSDEKNPTYYLLKTEVILDDQNLRVYSILHLDTNSVVRVLWSTLGTW